MRSSVVGLGMIALGIAITYWMMDRDTHILFLSAFGAMCGTASGFILGRGQGAVIGAAIGFIAPVAYLPLWFIFDLPPYGNFDL
jgi:hypothetical protein